MKLIRNCFPNSLGKRPVDDPRAGTYYIPSELENDGSHRISHYRKVPGAILSQQVLRRGEARYLHLAPGRHPWAL
jgi:hypothetical protein